MPLVHLPLLPLENSGGQSLTRLTTVVGSLLTQWLLPLVELSGHGGASPQKLGWSQEWPGDPEVFLPQRTEAWVMFTNRDTSLGEGRDEVVLRWWCEHVSLHVDGVVVALPWRAQSHDNHVVRALGGAGRLLSCRLGLRAAGGRDWGGES
jgi:hypothetical protein